MNVAVLKMCKVKTSYDSKKDALTAKNHAERKRLGKNKLRIYNCPICNKWHLTHKK